jgi:hypothetical protein
MIEPKTDRSVAFVVEVVGLFREVHSLPSVLTDLRGIAYQADRENTGLFSHGASSEIRAKMALKSFLSEVMDPSSGKYASFAKIA